MRKFPGIFLLSTGALAAVILLVFLSSGFLGPNTEKVLAGVKSGGVELGGCDKEEGILKLTELEKDLKSRRVALRYGGNTWQLLLNEAGFYLEKEEVMKASLAVGRRGSVLQRWQERTQAKTGGVEVPLMIGFDREKLTRMMKEYTGKITREPRDASFKILPDESVSVIPAEKGTSVDIDVLMGDIKLSLLEGKNADVNLHIIEAEPQRSTEMLNSTGVNGLLAGYTTYFDQSKASRSYNVSVAAQAFDELLVLPGHEVSFNDVVGPRSSESGYKTAPVIINNELVDGIGGGVCQVSTTLYNSVLLANLEIVERVSHALPVSYVPVGRDATVVFDAIDFKFLNNTDSYLYIKSLVGNGYLTIKIYGNTAYKRDVKVISWVTREIEPKTVYETDPNLPKGEQVVKQEGAMGYLAAAQRIVYRNGVMERKETLPSSDYNPVNKVIAVGVMEVIGPQIAPSTPSSPVGKPGGAGQGGKPGPPATGQTSPDLSGAGSGVIATH
ncbi:MAG: VanW family protein [Eubacteriales bacterium]